MFKTSLLSSLFLLAPLAAAAQSPDSGEAVQRASATLQNGAQGPAGSVALTQTPSGVLLTVTLSDLPRGAHGFHIHETGSCEPDFSAAGGHFAPGDHAHGLKVKEGAHAGDMPNIHIGDDGKLKIEILNPDISLKQGENGYLFDKDGSAIVIHSGADDYTSQPSGDAGDRIACGVIKKD